MKLVLINPVRMSVVGLPSSGLLSWSVVNTWSHVFILLSTLIKVTTPQGQSWTYPGPDKVTTGMLREYCEREIFNATCGHGEVVVAQSARYGRMVEGRCITGNYGKVGCARDVLPYLDERCSGRRTCVESVATLIPLTIQPCPGDFRSYLEASYECVKVASSRGNPNLCQASTHIAIRSQEGYLSNYITETTQLGSIDCPWLIEMKPGQTIRLTLLDFAGRESMDENVCHVYATIKEAAASTSETVCARRQRQTHVYTSSTNVVEVRLVTTKADHAEKEFYFLLKYEAIGCGDPVKPKNGWVERRDERATVGCSFSDQKWSLRCDGTTWIGSYGNCTGGDGFAASGSAMWKINFPSGLSIILIMCIALFIGIIILTVGLVCLRRKQQASRQPDPHTKVEQGPEVYNSYRRTSPRQAMIAQTSNTNPPHQHTFPRVGHLPKPPNPTFDQPENDYSRTWQLQRHPGAGGRNNSLPLPPGAFQGFDPRGGNGFTYPADQHVYESPKFERHELNSGSEDGSSEHATNAQYYELDPEAVPLDCGPAPLGTAREGTSGPSIDDPRLAPRNPLFPSFKDISK